MSDVWAWGLASNAQDDLATLSLDEQDRLVETLDKIDSSSHGSNSVTVYTAND